MHSTTFLSRLLSSFVTWGEKIKKGNAYGTEELFDCDGSLPFEILKEGNFQLNVKSNLWFHWFALLCSVIGPEKLASISQPIRYKTKTNHDLVARVFPRFRQFACFCFEFSSALQGYVFSFHLIGLRNQFGFGLGLTTVNRKGLYLHKPWFGQMVDQNHRPWEHQLIQECTLRRRGKIRIISVSGQLPTYPSPNSTTVNW